MEPSARGEPPPAGAAGTSRPAATAPPPNEILAVLRRAGLLALEERPRAEPLGGGVSSDIWLVETAEGPVCVKRALAKLKVSADWQAPVERSAFEAAWLREANALVPGVAPDLIHEDQAAGAVVMRYLTPGRHPLWKAALRAGQADPAFAMGLGLRLAAVHAGTARRPEVAERFASDAIFRAIRLEPYLGAAAAANPAHERALHRLARRTASTRLALVHGDVSPKNILVGPEGAVLLDAECAWYGDPAFDLAFCLNHLLLKCLWVPACAAGYLACFDALVEGYLAGAVWEPRAGLEARVADLLPGLFLARVDGKSPVEYVTDEADKERVRRVAGFFLGRPSETLAPIRLTWAAEVGA